MDWAGNTVALAVQHSITSATECGGFPCSRELPQQRPFWNKSSIYKLNSLLKDWATQGGVMTTIQAMCFGAMLAWTPSLVVLALLLRDAPLDEFERDPS